MKQRPNIIAIDAPALGFRKLQGFCVPAFGSENQLYIFFT